jgi:hypothetical protein
VVMFFLFQKFFLLKTYYLTSFNFLCLKIKHVRNFVPEKWNTIQTKLYQIYCYTFRSFWN